MTREVATFTCPQCTLADEAGDHGCSSGFVPFSSAAEDVDPEDVRGYIEFCRIINVPPEAWEFKILFRTEYGHIPGRDIQRLLDEDGE